MSCENFQDGISLAYNNKQIGLVIGQPAIPNESEKFDYQNNVRFRISFAKVYEASSVKKILEAD